MPSPDPNPVPRPDPFPEGAEAAPRLSVIVPVYQSWGDLPGLLAALAAQELRDFELIIVDNEPEARPEAAVRSALPADPPFRLLSAPAPGSYAARNAGAAVAQGARLVFTDADCRPVPGWLAAFAAADARAPLLAGPVRMRLGPDPGPWEIYDAVRGIPQERYIRRGYATTANLSVTAAVFRALGGFDATRFSGGDAEFCRRAGAAGQGIALVPGAVVDHPARASRAASLAKARRIKGGQVAAGPARRRALWTLRSLMPPLREMAAYLRDRRHPWRHRLVAGAVRLRLWGAELAEIVRLLVLRHPPERR